MPPIAIPRPGLNLSSPNLRRRDTDSTGTWIGASMGVVFGLLFLLLIGFCFFDGGKSSGRRSGRRRRRPPPRLPNAPPGGEGPYPHPLILGEILPTREERLYRTPERGTPRHGTEARDRNRGRGKKNREDGLLGMLFSCCDGGEDSDSDRSNRQQRYPLRSRPVYPQFSTPIRSGGGHGPGVMSEQAAKERELKAAFIDIQMNNNRNRMREANHYGIGARGPAPPLRRQSSISYPSRVRVSSARRPHSSSDSMLSGRRLRDEIARGMAQAGQSMGNPPVIPPPPQPRPMMAPEMGRGRGLPGAGYGDMMDGMGSFNTPFAHDRRHPDDEGVGGGYRHAYVEPADPEGRPRGNMPGAFEGYYSYGG